MALAAAYAISGLLQAELCSNIYGLSRFREDLIAVYSALPLDQFPHR